LDSLSKWTGILPVSKQLRSEVIIGASIPDLLFRLLCSGCHKKEEWTREGRWWRIIFCSRI